MKTLVRLRTEPAERRRSGAFCVETERDLQRALDGGFAVTELYMQPERWRDRAMIDRVAAAGGERFEITEQILSKVAYRRNPQGFVAVVAARVLRAERMPAAESGLFVVCGGLEKPGNVGAILRSADAAGASAVLLDRPDADVFNPNCVRASAGAVFTLPIVCDTAEALIGWFRRHAVPLLAVTPDAERSHTDADLTGACAIVVGSEAEGLNDTWRGAADAAVSIPMRGVVDSLNVSVATAIVLYEASRQRWG